MADHAILTAEAHGDLRVRTDRSEALGDGVMACLTVPDEFRQVQAHYPILFRLGADRETFSALALFGFTDGENLFLTDVGWDADTLPLAMAVQPFLIGGGASELDARQVHIDLASPRIGDGVRLFDEDARPTPFLEDMADKLGRLDEGYRASADFFAALTRHGLLEPLTLEVTLNEGSVNSLVGYHVIDEERLQELDGEALAALNDDDHLLPIFMAVASIGRLNDLVARKNRRLAGG